MLCVAVAAVFSKALSLWLMEVLAGGTCRCLLHTPAVVRFCWCSCVCIQGRDLSYLLCRTVLVDDTPLAFLHQPENGVPVLGFRGDPDDRLLLEAVVPLIQVRLVMITQLVTMSAFIGALGVGWPWLCISM